MAIKQPLPEEVFGATSLWGGAGKASADWDNPTGWKYPTPDNDPYWNSRPDWYKKEWAKTQLNQGQQQAQLPQWSDYSTGGKNLARLTGLNIQSEAVRLAPIKEQAQARRQAIEEQYQSSQEYMTQQFGSQAMQLKDTLARRGVLTSPVSGQEKADQVLQQMNVVQGMERQKQAALGEIAADELSAISQAQERESARRYEEEFAREQFLRQQFESDRAIALRQQETAKQEELTQKEMEQRERLTKMAQPSTKIKAQKGYVPFGADEETADLLAAGVSPETIKKIKELSKLDIAEKKGKIKAGEIGAGKDILEAQLKISKEKRDIEAEKREAEKWELTKEEKKKAGIKEDEADVYKRIMNELKVEESLQDITKKKLENRETQKKELQKRYPDMTNAEIEQILGDTTVTQEEVTSQKNAKSEALKILSEIETGGEGDLNRLLVVGNTAGMSQKEILSAYETVTKLAEGKKTAEVEKALKESQTSLNYTRKMLANEKSITDKLSQELENQIKKAELAIKNKKLAPEEVQPEINKFLLETRGISNLEGYEKIKDKLINMPADKLIKYIAAIEKNKKEGITSIEEDFGLE